ncbi:MAG: GCN5 family acetyltransferase [Brachymonas sp.]|nr:GCN5 family acetyltransferase [Brachymonas sp.]
MSLTPAYPPAISPDQVGEYDAHCFSGGGYFYDEVLEYRVWCHPERGAPDEAEGSDYFYAFATYEEASAFYEQTMGAEEPLVLVRQHEYIDEPQPGVYQHRRSERITEWLPQWLEGSKRTANSIAHFLQTQQQP